MTPLFLLALTASATTPRWAWEDAYDNVEGGDWLRDYSDDTGPYVANQQAYVLRALATMYEGTHDPAYLDRLAYQVDGLLALRNDNRGVTDYRGEESPCWREYYYSNGGGYCWTLHSGVTIEGQLWFAHHVTVDGLFDEVAYDGETFGAKADRYVAAAEETVRYHDQDWDDAGWYVIAEDTAPFLGGEAGTVLPMNQSNAMGIPLLLLYELTGEDLWLQHATALAARYYDGLVLMSWGGYAWTYYLDDVLDYGEDISHASLSVRFAIACWRAGLVFHDDDMERLAAIVGGVTVDDRTFWHALDARVLTNYNNYEASLYEWLPLTAFQPSIYTTVRNLYELSWPAADLTSATALEGWANLATWALPVCGAERVEGDWADDGDGWWSATGSEAHLGVHSTAACMIPLVLDADAAVVVDGSYTLQATDGELLRYLPVRAGDTRLTLAPEGSLRIRDVPEPVPPTISSEAPTGGTSVSYRAEARGDEPLSWSLTRYPTGARVDAATGGVTFVPAANGEYAFTLRVDNDAGHDEQDFDFCVPDPCQGEPDTADTGDTAEAVEPDTGAAERGPRPGPYPSSRRCGCGGGGGAGLALFALGLASRRRTTAAVALALGIDAPPEPTPPRASESPIVALTSGKVHTCALRADGTAVCWGSNASGQLDVPDARWAQLGAGIYHTCGVTTDGDARCWGWSAPLEAPPPSATFSSVQGAYLHGAGILADGPSLAWGVDEDALIVLREPSAVGMHDLSCGPEHCVLLDAEGTSYAWGAPYYVLGDQDGVTFVDLDAGYHANCGVTDSGELHCWGYNTHGQVSPPEDGSYTSVSCGGTFCCALDGDDRASCWGADNAGQQDVPDQALGQLAAGDSHVCALTLDGEVTCWGNDAQGQVSDAPLR